MPRPIEALKLAALMTAASCGPIAPAPETSAPTPIVFTATGRPSESPFPTKTPESKQEPWTTVGSRLGYQIEVPPQWQGPLPYGATEEQFYTNINARLLVGFSPKPQGYNLLRELQGQIDFNKRSGYIVDDEPRKVRLPSGLEGYRVSVRFPPRNVDPLKQAIEVLMLDTGKEVWRLRFERYGSDFEPKDLPRIERVFNSLVGPVQAQSAPEKTPNLVLGLLQDTERVQNENTDIAKRFLEALFAQDFDRMFSLFHPEVRDKWNNMSQQEKETFKSRWKIFASCKTSSLTRTRYVIEQAQQREVRSLTFELSPPCKVKWPDGSETLGEAIRVELWKTPDGKSAPYYFSDTFTGK